MYPKKPNPQWDEKTGKPAAVVPYVAQEANVATLTARSIDDIKEFAQLAHASGMFKDVKDVAQAAVKIMRGLELGLGPMESMSAIHMVEGKPTMSAQLMGALAARAGFSYRCIENTEQICRLAWRNRHGEDLGESWFSVEDAQRAGLLSRANWKKYPRAMLRARAIAEGARLYAPGALSGCYTPDELEVSINQQLPVNQTRQRPEAVEAEVKPAHTDDYPGEGWKKAKRRLAAIANNRGVAYDEVGNVVRLLYGVDSSTHLDANILHTIADEIDRGPTDKDRATENYCCEITATLGEDWANNPQALEDARGVAQTPWEAILIERLIAEARAVQEAKVRG